MANIAMGGFRWVKSRRGGNVQPVEERPVASAYGTGIFRGDCLKLVSDGTVAACAAGDAVYAIADTVMRYKNSSSQIVAGNYLPASTSFSGAPSLSNPQASIVRCTPVVGQIFEADVDTAQSSITVAQGNMFNNSDIVATAGSTTTGRSGHVVDGSSPGTGTAQFRWLEIMPDTLNDVTAVNWKVRGEFNEGGEPSATNATGT